MRHFASFLLILTVFIILLFSSPRHIVALDTDDLQTLDLGLHAGYSMLTGGYAHELRGGPYLSLSALTPFSKILYGFLNLAVSSHELSGSDGSQLYSVSLNMGPCFRVALLSKFGIDTTPFARLEYLFLKAQKLDREENTVKPGFGAKAGFFYAFSQSITVTAGFEFSQIWLSDTPFRSITMQGGISYNIFYLPSEDKIRASRIEEKLTAYSKADVLYAEGVKYFKQGDVFDAKSKFTETISLNKNHIEAQSYLEKISSIEKEYRLGVDHLEKKNFLAAIPPLERAAKSMKLAQEELDKTRALLSPQIPDLEKQAVSAYEKNDYETCIELMTKVKLIDPKNKTASIYLPRAKQRLEATKKLE